MTLTIFFGPFSSSFPNIYSYCIKGIRRYFFAFSFSICLCTTVVVTMKCQNEARWISQKKSSACYHHVHSHGTSCRAVMFFSLIAITAPPTCSRCQEPMDLTSLEWDEVPLGS